MEGSCQPVAPRRILIIVPAQKVMQAEGSLKPSLVCILVSWAKSSRINPHILCLLVITVERVQVLQSTGSMPVPPFIFVGSCRKGGGVVPRTFMHLAFG